LDENFPTRRKFSGNFQTTQNLGGMSSPVPACHDATDYIITTTIIIIIVITISSSLSSFCPTE